MVVPVATCKNKPSIKIDFSNNTIFYLSIHPRRVTVITGNYFTRYKVRYNIDNCFVKNGHLLIDFDIINPAGIYLLKVNNSNNRTRCEKCLKLTINTPERRY